MEWVMENVPSKKTELEVCIQAHYSYTASNLNGFSRPHCNSITSDFVYCYDTRLCLLSKYICGLSPSHASHENVAFDNLPFFKVKTRCFCYSMFPSLYLGVQCFQDLRY
jgi:hypothetical protein